jgi:phytoene dehydrogenase-like protein
MAEALGPRAAHPDLAGSALHLLAPASGSGLVVGGLQRLTDSLLAAAQGAGTEIRCGIEATDIRRHGSNVAGLRLADGAEIAARAVVSTLDLKRTFLSLFAWNDLPSEIGSRVGSFRMAGGTARLLLALDGLPERPVFASSDLFAGPIHIAPEASQFGAAYAAWRAGTIAPHLPIVLRAVSATDPRCCPIGGAAMTATVGCVPGRPFDGSWTNEKRDALREQVLASIERVLPGTCARIRACELIVPSDIEESLGCTDGDLWGGDIASDQMLGFRPWRDCAPPRTPIGGFYLAGPSTAAGVLGTCVSGVFAAQAVIADFKARHLK